MESQKDSDSSSATSGCSGVTDTPAVSRNVQGTPDILAELRARAIEAKQSASRRWRFAAERKLGDYECGIGIGKEMMADEILGWLDDIAPPSDSTARSRDDE